MDARDARGAAVHRLDGRRPARARAATTWRWLASQYLDALADGEVPLEFLFSGTVFYAGDGGQLQAARISWEQDAEYRLPVRGLARDDGAPLPGQRPGCGCRKESFDRLCAYKARHALATWEDVVDALLDEER